MVVINSDQYEKIRADRELEIPKHDEILLQHNNILFLYVEDLDRIVAEYDIDTVKEKKNMTMLTLEPIYNSPDGIEPTDLLLLTLPHYTLEEWKENLQSSIFPISELDASELISRLKR